ncbi:MAG: T9SS type A sorting domain-containing protein, partial [Bacteroidales bacterium]
PGSSTNVVIPTGAAMYPVGSSYTIGSGYGMVLEPGAQLTMTSLTNYGDLKLRSDASNISSLITNSSGVSAIIELYLTGGEAGTKNYKWHYISIPVSTLPVSIFNGTTLDIVGYAEPRVTTDLLQGWVAWDGYVYSGGGQDDTYKFTDLVPGKGYDYWDNATPGTTFSFTGQLNSSALSPITLSYGGYPTLSGWNLLGNPFPSGIDWDVVTASGYPANTGKAVYFTKDNVQYTYAAGTGIPENATSHIPPMQGFFIRTYGTGNTFTVPTTAREHNSTARYKGAKTIIPLVRLKLTEDSISDETIVRFDESAKPDLDYDFDATKSFYSLESPGIWSITGGVKYAINGQPFPESGTTLSVPITVNLTSDALIHSITATQLQGLDDYNVSLFDNVTGFTANLKTTPTLTFTASAGLITDRFVLKFSDVLTGMENPVVSGNIFNIYSGFGFINIQTLGDDWDGKQGSVTVFDFSGRTVSDLKNIGFSKNSVTHITAPSTTGIYIIELRSGVKRYVGKVVIN